MNFFKTETHTLDEVKTSLDQDINTSFIALLEKHHDFLEESISVLMSRDAAEEEKQRHLGRFLHLINMHAKAEEETLYLGLMNSVEKLPRVEGNALQDEHDIAFVLADELRELNFDRRWNEAIEAKAQVLAGLVQNHIKEEESEVFKTAKREISADEFESLRDDYLDKCKLYLEDEMHEPFTGGNHMDLNRPSSAV
jgi:hemerythrin-like domain-containing protein